MQVKSLIVLGIIDPSDHPQRQDTERCLAVLANKYSGRCEKVTVYTYDVQGDGTPAKGLGYPGLGRGKKEVGFYVVGNFRGGDQLLESLDGGAVADIVLKIAVAESLQTVSKVSFIGCAMGNILKSPYTSFLYRFGKQLNDKKKWTPLMAAYRTFVDIAYEGAPRDLDNELMRANEGRKIVYTGKQRLVRPNGKPKESGLRQKLIFQWQDGELEDVTKQQLWSDK